MSTAANAQQSTSVVNTANKPSATTEVVTNQQTAFNQPSSARPKVFNEFGVQAVKGGQTVGIGFFDACVTSYSNLVNSPLALAFMFIASIGFMSRYTDLQLTGNFPGPIVIMHNALLHTSQSTQVLLPIRTIAAFLQFVFRILVMGHRYVDTAMLFGAVYLAKPSKNNAWISSVLTLVCWMSSIGFLEILILGHVYFLYTQLRDPVWKFMLAFLAVFVIIMGYTHVSLMTGANHATAIPSSLPNIPTATPTNFTRSSYSHHMKNQKAYQNFVTNSTVQGPIS